MTTLVDSNIFDGMFDMLLLSVIANDVFIFFLMQIIIMQKCKKDWLHNI